MAVKKEELVAFLKFLDSNNILCLKDLLKNDARGFNNRLKLQKLVYLSRYFGLNMDYSYHLYIHGPYSSELAKDYYALTKSDHKELELNFDKEAFLKQLKNKNERWLEIVATASDVASANKELSFDNIVTLTSEIKHNFPKEDIIEIANDAKSIIQTQLKA